MFGGSLWNAARAVVSPPMEIDLQTMSRTAAIMKIIRAFLDDTISDERWFLDRLADRAKVEIDSERLGRELFMSWDQVTATGRLRHGPDDRLTCP